MDQSNQPVNYEVPPTLPNSTLAIVSLIAGIAGFTLFPVLGSIIALVTGYMARNETRATPPTASGDGLATAGIVTGYIGIGLFLVGICCFVVWFVFIGGMAIWGVGTGQ